MITTSGQPVVLTIDDPTMAGQARRAAVALAGNLGFDETERGRVAIVASELATNLSKHASSGEIVIQGIESGSMRGIEILTLDKGPGMVDVDRCLVDGYSTAGSSGTGLGASARLSALFEIQSLAGTGTVALARLWSAPAPGIPPVARLQFGAVNVPLKGEHVCGDCWALESVEGRTILLVVDGLGHGPQAAEAAREAVHVFEDKASLGPAEIIQSAHASLRSTRGAALAVAQMDVERGELRFAGVGNIAGSIFGLDEGRSLSLVSHNGIVGHTIRKIQEFTYPWAAGSLLVMHSDGIGTRWQLDRYAGLASRHPGLIAGTLYRDFRRERDDVTVVAIRSGSSGPR